MSFLPQKPMTFRIVRIAALSLGVLLLQSCSHLQKDLDEITQDDSEKKEDPGKADRFAFLKTETREISKVRGATESINEELVQTDADKELPSNLKSKTEKIPVTALAPKPETPKTPLHFYDDFVILNGDEEITVNLVFNSAPLLDVIPSFADALGFNFLADSDLKGVVTLNIDQKMTRKELWDTFDKMLNLSGAGVTVEGTLLRIMALPKVARQADSRLAKDGTGELFYYPLKNTTAKEVVNQIKPFVGNNAVCVELTRPNAVMIADDRANMPKIKQLLDVIDMSGKSNWKRKILLCSNILPSKLTDELKTILPVLGFNVQQITDKTETPGSVQISGLDRLHILVVSAADPNGLIGVLEKGKIKYQFMDHRPKVNKDVTGVIPFEDGYLVYDRYPYENSLLLNGLLIIPTKEWSFYAMADRDTYVDIFDTMFNRRNLIDAMQNFYALMVDPITKDILNRLDMPTDFTRLMLYCVGTLADNSFQIDSAYYNTRIRSNEIINAYLYKELATAWEQWRIGRIEKFSIRERAIIDQLLTVQTVDPHSKLNMTLEAENNSLIKLKGPSGMNEDHSFTLEKRAYHPSMRGIIAMNTTPSGEVGIGRHLTLNANVDDARGFVNIEKQEYDGTELASAGELLQTFGPESADIERVAMAISQSKHLVPVASQTSGLVNYDMERTIPYLSNDFAFRAKQDGKVVEIKDDIMIVQYKDGTYDDIDLSRHPDKNVDGGFYIMNQMQSDLNVGNILKANDIIAFDPKYINSNDMFGDPCADVGCLGRIVIETNGAVYEDSGYCTDEFAHRMATKITRQKRVIFSQYANIKKIAKVGDKIKANDPILIFDDTSEEFSSQLLASIADQEEDSDDAVLATGAPVISKIAGTISDIFIYYTIPLEDMTPSMKKIVEEYDRKAKTRSKTLAKYISPTDSNTIVKPAEKLTPDSQGKVKGVPVGDGIIIDFYIEYDDILATGDKSSSLTMPGDVTQIN